MKFFVQVKISFETFNYQVQVTVQNKKIEVYKITGHGDEFEITTNRPYIRQVRKLKKFPPAKEVSGKYQYQSTVESVWAAILKKMDAS